MSPVLADGLLITAPPGKSWARILPCSIFELCNQGVRESVSKQVDKEPRGPQGERGLEFSRRKKGQTFFLSLHSLGLYNNNVSCLRTVSG